MTMAANTSLGMHEINRDRDHQSARTIEEWFKIFSDGNMKANAVNCAYLVVEALSQVGPGPRNKDREADQIANAMLAFKRIGADDGQVIYVESDWVTKFVSFLIERSFKYRLEHEKDEKCKIMLPTSINLREELPSHLRGKFSVNP
jgi:hypothetical protein